MGKNVCSFVQTSQISRLGYLFKLCNRFPSENRKGRKHKIPYLRLLSMLWKNMTKPILYMFNRGKKMVIIFFQQWAICANQLYMWAQQSVEGYTIKGKHLLDNVGLWIWYDNPSKLLFNPFAFHHLRSYLDHLGISIY